MAEIATDVPMAIGMSKESHERNRAGFPPRNLSSSSGLYVIGMGASFPRTGPENRPSSANQLAASAK